MKPFTLKNNGRALASDEILIYRDLVYRRNVRTGEWTCELVRQKVVYKNFENYFKRMLRFWHHPDRSVAQMFTIFAETWCREYLSYSNFTSDAIDTKIKSLLKLLPKTTHDGFLTFRHYLILVDLKESLLYLRNREDYLEKNFLPRKYLDLLISKLRLRVKFLRKQQACSRQSNTPFR